jgi:hypothetical protein
MTSYSVYEWMHGGIDELLWSVSLSYCIDRLIDRQIDRLLKREKKKSSEKKSLKIHFTS